MKGDGYHRRVVYLWWFWWFYIFFSMFYLNLWNLVGLTWIDYRTPKYDLDLFKVTFLFFFNKVNHHHSPQFGRMFFGVTFSKHFPSTSKKMFLVVS